MTIQNQIFVISAMFFLSFVYLRGFLYGVKRYQLNNNAYKKRKNGETIKEWMFYTRYKEEIPKILLILYYVVLLVHIAGIMVCVLLYLINISFDIGKYIAISIVLFDLVWTVIIALLFWTSKHDQAYAYERWIAKRRGQKREK